MTEKTFLFIKDNQMYSSTIYIIRSNYDRSRGELESMFKLFPGAGRLSTSVDDLEKILTGLGYTFEIWHIINNCPAMSCIDNVICGIQGNY